MVTAREDPCAAAINSLRPSTVIPLRKTPRTVGKRGSSLKEFIYIVYNAHHCAILVSIDATSIYSVTSANLTCTFLINKDVMLK